MERIDAAPDRMNALAQRQEKNLAAFARLIDERATPARLAAALDRIEATRTEIAAAARTAA